MAIIINVTSGGVPPGEGYLLKLTGINSVNNQYGNGLRFEFQCISGEHSSKKVSRTIGSTIKPDNANGKFLAGVLGKPLSTGQLDLEANIGKTFIGKVVVAEKGTKVESVVLPPT